jgi:hypothetical protein
VGNAQNTADSPEQSSPYEAQRCTKNSKVSQPLTKARRQDNSLGQYLCHRLSSPCFLLSLIVVLPFRLYLRFPNVISISGFSKTSVGFSSLQYLILPPNLSRNSSMQLLQLLHTDSLYRILTVRIRTLTLTADISV